MARFPRPGAVKTRLAREIGTARATALYRAFLGDLQERFGAGVRPLVWLYDPPHAPFAELLGAGAACCVPQRGADLAERLRHAFEDLASARGGLIVTGADVPHLPDACVEAAEHALGASDVVLGPARDGGYYLIAMRAAHDVFSGVEMGTARVLSQTLARARTLGLRAHLLEPSFDVDELADLERLRDLLATAPALADCLPRTAALLRTPA